MGNKKCVDITPRSIYKIISGVINITEMRFIYNKYRYEIAYNIPFRYIFIKRLDEIDRSNTCSVVHTMIENLRDDISFNIYNDSEMKQEDKEMIDKWFT